MRDIINLICLKSKLSIDYMLSTPGNIYTFLNPVSYILARNNKEYYKKFDAIFPDGSVLILFIKLFYGKRVIRRSFDMTSIAPRLFEYACENNKSLYFIGSKLIDIEQAMLNLKKRYIALNIVSYRDGYFESDIKMKQEMHKILEMKPDFLIVGMGAERQEKFLLDIKEAGFKGIGFTCGGFLHQTSNDRIFYYPQWVDRCNLRFLYRMFKEKHTRKRYIKAAFIFPVFFIYDRFFFKGCI